MPSYKCKIYNFNYTHEADKDKSEWTTTEVPLMAEAVARGQDEREAAAAPVSGACASPFTMSSPTSRRA